MDPRRDADDPVRGRGEDELVEALERVDHAETNALAGALLVQGFERTRQPAVPGPPLGGRG
eukprot:11220068-Lingulodinium_polyedra.AAC.1